MYLLDTNILIHFLKGNSIIKENMSRAGLEKLAICEVSLAELYYGAYYSQRPQKNLAIVDKIRHCLPVLSLEEEATRFFGKIKSTLRRQGNLIEDFDILLAAVALAHELILVTNNIKHFDRIEELRLENWLSEQLPRQSEGFSVV